MVEQACKDNAPDEAFARRLEQAIRVFGAKGPPTNHIPSAWHKSVREETARILDAGEEGFRVDLALSHSGSARQRWFSVIHFGLRRDAKSLRELERMLEDRSARIRRHAVRWYASRIHPDRSVTGPFETRNSGGGERSRPGQAAGPHRRRELQRPPFRRSGGRRLSRRGRSAGRRKLCRKPWRPQAQGQACGRPHPGRPMPGMRQDMVGTATGCRRQDVKG